MSPSNNQNTLADAITEGAFSEPVGITEQQTVAAFVDQVFFVLLIQADDDVFDTEYSKLVSPQVQEDANDSSGSKLDFTGFKRLLKNFREALSGRRLISSKVIIAPSLPGDDKPTTSTVGHTAVFEGIDEKGNILTFNVLVVGTVMNLANGRSQLILEKLVITRNPLV
jgi:hypothetical protein